MALHFPLRHEAVVAVVAGMRSAEEARYDVEMMERPVASALWDEL